MTPQEKNQITQFNSTLSGSIQIGVLTSNDGSGEAFTEFCQELSRLAPKIQVARKDADQADGPAIEVGSQLIYRAIPTGKELEPFLEAVASVGGSTWNLPEPVRETVSNIHIPADLKLYIAPECPFCPAVVREIMPLALAGEFIRLTVIDSVMFPESAQSDGIRSVPTLILENQIRWTGTVNIGEIAHMILNRDPLTLSVSSLKNMLGNGDATLVARMMLDSGKIFPAFIELLAHEKWPVRLGAMVALETIAEENATLAAGVIGPLWERFPQVSDAVKGDILHVFGETGHGDAAGKLKAVLSGPYTDEMKEVAGEALEKIVGVHP